MTIFSLLALVLPYEEVLKHIAQKLQSNILEGECRTVEKFKQVEFLKKKKA